VKAVSGKHFCKVLREHGRQLQRIRGTHHIFSSLKTGTLRKLLRDAELTDEDL
jgi:predicted RNA binding protein YcfA (HicA-like mRNA interferase family)